MVHLLLDGEAIEVTAFTTEVAEAIRQVITTFQLPYLVDSHWDYAYTDSEDHPIYKNIDPLKAAKKVALEDIRDIVKVVLFPGDYLDAVLSELQKLPVCLYEHTSENIVDISLMASTSGMAYLNWVLRQGSLSPLATMQTMLPCF